MYLTASQSLATAIPTAASFNGPGELPPPLRCIVMDDSVFDRRAIMRFASKSRYAMEIIETKSIAETRERLLHMVPDIVFADCRVTDGDGIGFARELSLASPGGPAIIVVTGDDRPDAVIDALRAGVSDFLTKDSLTPELFDDAVTNAIRGRGYGVGDGEDAKELAELREITVRNMHTLKALFLPLLANAWRTASGQQSEAPKGALSRAQLAQKARKVPELIDSTVIAALVGAGGRPLERVALTDVVRGILDEPDHCVQTGKARVKVGRLPVIAADSARIRMLFSLLITGSVASSPIGKNPHIKISASQDPEGNAIIVVEDNGLPMSVRRQTFGAVSGDMGLPASDTSDPFAWSLCQRLTEQMNGAFKLQGGDEAGMKVMLRFPAHMVE